MIAMRTTLDIADDVLLAAKEIAQREKKSTGQVVSDWARTALLARSSHHSAAVSTSPLARYGIVPLPARGGVVTEALINRLREQEGI
jgi:hypothetical protein